ncbi:MAG: antibiotic biosynthesis monooxygenase [Sphingobacteriales bacterium]|nr:antibiotic biosynthesis monooxygenase [Sphingobacteriales bacterium]MCC7223542.1 antibiotic biosynthesis monooxygenase [Chitinophagales bacterium]
MIAQTPAPPYYAVIFTSIRTIFDDEGYNKMGQLMIETAAIQPGFLGVESARNEVGITVSYWDSLAAIRQWRLHADHLVAQRLGREKWYRCYKLRICLVEHDAEMGE